MLIEFEQMREQVVRKEKDLRSIGRNFTDQEIEISLKNTRLIAGHLIELDRELDA